jgi:hypothetical protein
MHDQLLNCINNDDINRLKQYIHIYRDTLNDKDENGDTPLHTILTISEKALNNDDIKTVKIAQDLASYMIKLGADINLISGEGEVVKFIPELPDKLTTVIKNDFKIKHNSEDNPLKSVQFITVTENTEDILNINNRFDIINDKSQKKVIEDYPLKIDNLLNNDSEDYPLKSDQFITVNTEDILNINNRFGIINGEFQKEDIEDKIIKESSDKHIINDEFQKEDIEERDNILKDVKKKVTDIRQEGMILKFNTIPIEIRKLM